MSRRGALAILAVTVTVSGTGAAAAAAPAAVEAAVARASALVKAKHGAEYGVLEVMVCRESPLVKNCPEQEPMLEIGEAGFVRAMYVLPTQTFPNVEARINLTTSPPHVDLIVHQEPFIEDNVTEAFPPASGLTFASAWSAVTSALPKTRFTEATWRRPLHPCVSEDLIQFVAAPANPPPRAGGGASPPSAAAAEAEAEDFDVISVGCTSRKVCQGFITNEKPDEKKICAKPHCYATQQTSLWVV